MQSQGGKVMKINELSNHYNEEVTISGFVDNVRNLQWVQFIVLRDHTSKVQITIEKSEESNKKMVELVNDLTVESTIKVTGKLLENEKVKLNGMEIIPTSIEVTSKCLEELPINYKDEESAALDTRLDYRFLDLRNEKHMLIFQVQSA